MPVIVLYSTYPVLYRLVGRLGFSSYTTYSVSHKLSIIPPRGSVRVQE